VNISVCLRTAGLWLIVFLLVLLTIFPSIKGTYSPVVVQLSCLDWSCLNVVCYIRHMFDIFYSTLCLRKTRHPFYFCDIFVTFHPILPILDRNKPQTIWNKDVYTPPTTSYFICSYCTLKNFQLTTGQRTTPVTPWYFWSGPRDKLWTPNSPYLNLVYYKDWDVTSCRSVSAAPQYLTFLIWRGAWLLHGLVCSSLPSARQSTSGVDGCGLCQKKN